MKDRERESEWRARGDGNQILVKGFGLPSFEGVGVGGGAEGGRVVTDRSGFKGS